MKCKKCKTELILTDIVIEEYDGTGFKRFFFPEKISHIYRCPKCFTLTKEKITK